MKYRKKIILPFFIILIVALSGCIYLENHPSNTPSDDWLIERASTTHIDGGTQQWSYVELGDWIKVGTFPQEWAREFTAYSYDPDDPANEGITGGWCEGYVITSGEVVVTFYS